MQMKKKQKIEEPINDSIISKYKFPKTPQKESIEEATKHFKKGTPAFAAYVVLFHAKKNPMNAETIRDCSIFWKILNSSSGNFEMNQVLESSSIFFARFTTGYILQKYNETLNLRFVPHDGSEPIVMKVRQNTKFSKMYALFSNSRGVDPNSFRCLFDGKCLKYTETPFDYKIEDGETVDIIFHQVGC